MKVVKTVELYNDLGEKLNVGGAVKIEAHGKIFEGTIKAINLSNLAITLKGGSSYTILYKNIEVII